MDNVQDILGYLPLPNSILTHLTTHSTTYLTLFQRLQTIRKLCHTQLINPLLNHLIYPALLRLYNSPDILTIVLLGVLLLISLKILELLRRAVVFWVRMFTRLAFWGSILVAGVYVWGRGWEGALEDGQRWGGEIAALWMREYRRYEAAQQDGQTVRGMNRGAERGYRGR
jgi:hypothetical protein